MKYTSEYSTSVHVRHKSGEQITIEVSGKTADKVAYVANKIKDTFEEASVPTLASSSIPLETTAGMVSWLRKMFPKIK